MKDIPGFEGLYAVTKSGKVWSYPKERSSKKGKFLAQRLHHGYYQVHLYKDKKGFHREVHRLVGLAFIPNPENKREINHKNGNGGDNRMENLEWTTPKENMRHAIKHGFKTPGSGLKGEFVKNHKLTDEKVREIRKKYIKGVYGFRKLSKEFGVKNPTIIKILRNEAWAHVK